MTEDKKKTEFLARRINFEENLQKSLEEAHRRHQNGDFKGMCYVLQNIWRQCHQRDREIIIDLVEEREDQTDRNTRTRASLEGKHIDTDGFLELITASRHYAHTQTDFEEAYHENDWLDILSVTSEALNTEYHGKRREYWKGYEEE